MTRSLTSAVLSQITAKAVQVGILVELNTDAGPVRAWSGIGDLISGGNTFQGVGHLGGISPVQESGAEIRANALSLQLSGIPSSLISTALTTQYQGRPAKVWLAFFEPKVNPYALSFDGVGNKVEMPHHAAYNVASLTLEAWVKPNVQSDNGAIFEKSVGEVVNTQYALFQEGPGVWVFRGGTVDLTTPIAAGDVGVQVHLAGTYDGTNKRLYKNGVLVAGPTASGGLATGTGKSRIGALFVGGTSALQYPFDGLIDEVRIWNVARTQPQIAADRFRRLVGNESGLVGYWRIDEGSGTQAKDATANANHGTISGAAWTQDTAPLVGDLAFSTPGLIADPILVFSGRADVMLIDEGPETATITVTVESRLADLLRPRVRRYTDQEQKAMFPGDRGLEFVASLQDRELQWGGGAASGTSLPPVTIDEGGQGGWRA